MKGRKRAFIVTDRTMEQIGYVQKVTDVLDSIGVSYRTFSQVKPDPDISNVNSALTQVRSFEPDLLIALGGGSPMDAAKFIWLLYEYPDLKFEDIAMRFIDIRKPRRLRVQVRKLHSLRLLQMIVQELNIQSLIMPLLRIWQSLTLIWL